MRLLIAVARFPWPAHRGDQKRAVQVAGLLADGGHEVHLLVPEPDGDRTVPADLPYGVETYRRRRSASVAGVARAGLSGLPLQAGLYRQPDLGRRLRELAPRFDLAVLQLVRLVGHARDLGDTPFLVDLVDSLALNFERRAEHDSPWLRPPLALEARRLLTAERSLARRAAGTLLVCDRDRTWLAERLSEEVAERLAVVPLVVPTQAGEGRSAGGAARDDDEGAERLVFTGNLGYFVNADAAAWWVDAVWPAVRAARPGLTLTLAGARPAGRVRRAARAPGVELLDTPPDLAPVLASARVALAPMRAGSGVPVKVLEAWAAGVPVVASPWAAAGAGARPDHHLLVAGSPREWRDAVLRLLDDADLARRLAEAGRRRLASAHSPQAARRALDAAVARAIPA